MYCTAIECFKDMDAAILCAAVADFKPEFIADNKIKREKDNLTITLKPTHDIAAELGRNKKGNQKLIGFALETNNEVTNAEGKLKRKNLDFIVLNSLRTEGTCFRSDDNKISIISENGQKDFEKKNKQAVAEDIINEMVSIL